MTFHEFQTQVFTVLNAVQPDAVQLAATPDAPAFDGLEAVLQTVRATAETLAGNTAPDPDSASAIATLRTNPAGLVAIFTLVGQIPPEHLMKALNDAFNRHQKTAVAEPAPVPVATLLLTICDGIRLVAT